MADDVEPPTAAGETDDSNVPSEAVARTVEDLVQASQAPPEDTHDEVPVPADKRTAPRKNRPRPLIISGLIRLTGWLTAFGVVFAGSQVVVMAMQAALEGIAHMPYVTLEYEFQTDTDKTTNVDILANNRGPGTAIVNTVTLKRGTTSYVTFDRVVGDMYAPLKTKPPPFHRPNAISGQVIAPESSLVMLRLDDDQRKIVRATIMNPRQTTFEICYCSTMSISWVGRVVSWIGGIPYCWVADREQTSDPTRSRTRVRPLRDMCPINTFED